MKALIDFLPWLAFLLVYHFVNIYAATAVLMIGTVLQIVLIKFLYKRIEIMYWITLVFVLFFGALTLIFHDPIFIKWKVSIVSWLFGLALLYCQFFTPKSAMEYLMGSMLNVPAKAWRNISWLWAIYFIAIGSANLIVMFYFSTEVWVYFKVIGLSVCSLVIAVLQMFILWPYIKHQAG